MALERAQRRLSAPANHVHDIIQETHARCPKYASKTSHYELKSSVSAGKRRGKHRTRSVECRKGLLVRECSGTSGETEAGGVGPEATRSLIIRRGKTPRNNASFDFM